jgi:hypothetical protein
MKSNEKRNLEVHIQWRGQWRRQWRGTIPGTDIDVIAVGIWRCAQESNSGGGDK